MTEYATMTTPNPRTETTPVPAEWRGLEPAYRGYTKALAIKARKARRGQPPRSKTQAPRRTPTPRSIPTPADARTDALDRSIGIARARLGARRYAMHYRVREQQGWHQGLIARIERAHNTGRRR